MAQSPEQKKSYQVVKNFKALNTKANRTALQDEEFAWLENIQPIGFGNLKTVPQSSNVSATITGAVTWSNNVTSIVSCNIKNEDYIVAFLSDGAAQYFNITTETQGNVASSGTFTGTGVRAKQWKDERIMITDPEKGYSTWDGANLVPVGCISIIGVTDSGNNYSTTPDVTISAPDHPNGVQAIAYASISNATGTITQIIVDNPGSGYTSIPQVNIAAPASAFGTQAQGSAVLLSNTVVGISITNPGAGYTSAPAVTISGGGGSSANAYAVLGSGQVQSIVITEPGSGYNSAPTITISGGGGNNATAIAGYVTFAKGSVGLVVKNGGSGYTSAPSITISAPPVGGNTANAIAIVNGGLVTSVIVDDPGSGYTSNPTVTVSGGGGNGAVIEAVATLDTTSDVASFQGHTWISQGRTVFYSAAGSYNDFVTVSAGNLNLIDDTLHSKITALISANNFLYVFGDDSINVFSDVRVGTNGQTIFTNTNVSASVGSRRINAIFPYFRSLLFMNDYGVYALVGATTTKLSDSLDGIFPNIDFNYPISGGEVLINNILCAAFNFWYKDPVQGVTRPIQAVFFDKKWFITSQGTLSYVTTVPKAETIALYGTDGTNLVQLYSDKLAAINSKIQTALWPLNDIIRDKQALKFGVEATTNTPPTIDVTVDSEYYSSPATTFTNLVSWINTSNQVIPWQNNALTTIPWYFGSGYFLYKSDAQQYGKYLGLTITSPTPQITFNTFEMEYELRARF